MRSDVASDEGYYFDGLRRQGTFQAGRRGFESRLPLQSHEFRGCAYLTLSSGKVTDHPFHLDLSLHHPMICRFLPGDQCILPEGRVLCYRSSAVVGGSCRCRW